MASGKVSRVSLSNAKSSIEFFSNELFVEKREKEKKRESSQNS